MTDRLGSQEIGESFGLSRPTLTALARLMRADYTLRRPSLKLRLFDSILSLASSVQRSPAPLVYIAFDGDHFGLTAMMKSYVTARSAVPVHPESVLGYKETVDAHGGGKIGVLLDDLALVRRCDEMIIFTDVSPSVEAIAQGLAEGVLIELLFFLKHSRPVSVVPIQALLDRRARQPKRVTFTHEALRSQLGDDQRGVGRFLDELECGNLVLPKTAYIVHDPLDSKYLDWLRRYAYERQRVPLMPYFALDPRDLTDNVNGLSLTLAGWALMLRLADELFYLPSLEDDRRESYVVGLLTAAWQAGRPFEKISWQDLAIPKVANSAEWAITDREAGI